MEMALRVVELFAGVGGFRIGFEGPPSASSRDEYRVIWSNQWEPTTNLQHAAEVYAERWGMVPDAEDDRVFRNPLHEDDVFVNKDISTIDAAEIPEHDILCGGFPCQDYSVAKTLNTAKGIAGKKGVLWWEIHRIVEHHMPSYLLLENVDRLLKSPARQRGRDFAVMLASLDDLGYAVEWRVIDASQYGFPQRRKRVFIMAHGPGTPGHDSLTSDHPPHLWIEQDGVFARSFPVARLGVLMLNPMSLREHKDADLADITEAFNTGSGKDAKTPFLNAGFMVGGDVWTAKTTSSFDGAPTPLGKVLVTPGKVPDEFILDPDSLTRPKGWIYLKGSKRESRKGTDGFTYSYNEGPVTFPDALDRPSRTIVTGEGGKAPSRFKHVVTFRPTKKQRERLSLDSRDAARARSQLDLKKSEWVRRLIPIELERLNGFPDGHTAGATDGRRAFFMGNALVCGVVSRIAAEL